jgi:type I restriction enzyme, R subunit
VVLISMLGVTSTSKAMSLGAISSSRTSLSGIYAIVCKAYAKGVQPDRDFLRKTNDLVQRHIDTDRIGAITQFVEINPETLKVIREQKAEYNTKVIYLVKSIEKAAEDASEDPYLIGMAERANRC